MHLARFASVACGCLVLLVSTAACGSATSSDQGSDVTTWVNAVCAAEADFVLTEDRQSRAAIDRMFAAETPGEWRDVLGTSLRQGETLSDRLVADLHKAGAPNVDHGDEMEAKLEHYATLLGALYHAAGKQVATFDPAHPREMQRKAQTTFPRLKESETTVLTQLANTFSLNDGIARQAQANKDCQSAWYTQPNSS